jgi:hypothetical protein
MMTLTCAFRSATHRSRVRGGQPCPPRIAAIKLSVAETARLTALAAQHAAGLITRARIAFALRWSLRRRKHQATARWHHHSTRLAAAALSAASQKEEVTRCNRQPRDQSQPRSSAIRTASARLRAPTLAIAADR